jgi:hypothetical protein
MKFDTITEYSPAIIVVGFLCLFVVPLVRHLKKVSNDVEQEQKHGYDAHRAWVESLREGSEEKSSTK